MNNVALLLLAGVVYAFVQWGLPMLSPLEVVRSDNCHSAENRICIRASDAAVELKRFGRGLACEELFGLSAESRGVFARWQELHRTTLLAARKPGPERDLVAESREALKARHAAGSPQEKHRIRRGCHFHNVGEYGVDTSNRSERAIEVISNYEICTAAVPGFERDHAGDFKVWKRSNRDGVNAVYWSRGSMRRKQWLDHVRDSELRRLQDGSDEDRREQAEWCRTAVVPWLRSGA